MSVRDLRLRRPTLPMRYPIGLRQTGWRRKSVDLDLRIPSGRQLPF
jgi:hypothetical protein